MKASTLLWTIWLMLAVGVFGAQLTGCAFGGAKETNSIVMCEPGSIVEVATDEKIPVITNPGAEPKDQVVAKKNCAGMVLVPKSVYREMRACWVKAHPEQPQ
jgi:hypothetical protein